MVLATTVAVPTAGATESRFTVLVFSKWTNFYHDSIPAGIEAIEELGAANDFDVEATDDASIFNDEDLDRFDAIVFNNTNSTPESGDLLDADQRAAFQRYIQDGGGWVGLHAASASERDWDWYEGLVGAIFDQHPEIQPGRVKVLDGAHPSTSELPELWERNEEWYNWTANPTGNVHTLAQIKVRDGIEGLDEGVDHPFSWCQNYDGGRSWFTAGGHASTDFSDELFLNHLLGGIEWAAGAAPGDCSATQTGNFQQIPLVTEGLADPFELAVAPDRRVFYIERTGALKIVDQETLAVSTALDFDYTAEMTSQSDGLLGLTLDPDFAENNFLYLLYSDKDEAKLNVSRFTVEGDSVDLATEARLLEIPTFRGEGRANSHMAGSLAIHDNGDLYIATGDNTDPFASDGFSPIDEREGRRAWDAQATAGNTNDLRGKILRITPQDDGSYTIPEDNLFAEGTELTRPEIYAMGMRNPFRITVDSKTDAVLVGDYGPDARAADPNRGPEGTVEFDRITEASNRGWPYCTGANTPFNDYDFATSTAGEPFDCANLVNDSPNNTGLTELPPAAPAWVHYAYSESEEFPELGTGGGGPMGGPVYSYDPDNERITKFPEYFDGKWFTYELTRQWFKTMSIHQTSQEFTDPRFEPTNEGDLHSINGIFEDMSWIQPFEAEFGPDGSLYVIDFGEGSGTGRGGSNEGSGIYRVDYVAEGRVPTAAISAGPDSGQGPLEVSFSSEGSGAGEDESVRYEWDFDNDGTIDSTEENPTHVYTENGQYSARLTVTNTETELAGVAVTTITVGNTRPEVRIDFPHHGGMFDFGDTIPFTVEVTDAEDTEIDCSRVVVQSQLGHDDHLHPMDNVTGCQGEFITDQGDSHGPGQNLFAALSAQYQDGGGTDDVPPLVGSAHATLEPKRKEAEHFEDTGGDNDGVQAVSREGSSAGRRIAEIEHGDWVAYDPINLTEIDSVTMGVSSGGIGGTVEFRADAPDGELLGSVEVGNTGGWDSVISPTVPLTDPGGPITLYAVFTNPEWAADGPDLMSVDWLHFNGQGVTKPEISATVEPVATPNTGAAPLTVDFSAEVTAPEGREIVDYHWEFGDNQSTHDETASHEYTRSGPFTARLTVTDDAGVRTSATVDVSVD
ncbi:ThuA domain-containing protein [Actinoalloteichus hymeniacidonis]|uniref:PKD domain protein,CBM6-containing protein n=1 Tax=Actinoalloteichus hymeniacidonis TaxID=340345 RepID=A0AAC9HQC8_9PSEU|nr:ThuA domain-containing protein [Actinoalloteichus hymeniacidonis]AOS63414.1 PKD domain protein,CBM6-containing protein [Actinoalloteichus hymeniacidonis]MBB5908545.1 PKD repeat protein/glucose/arabinose dehydrogenase [Actinoalloteichus hymeniacidonis]